MVRGFFQANKKKPASQKESRYNFHLWLSVKGVDHFEDAWEVSNKLIECK